MIWYKDYKKFIEEIIEYNFNQYIRETDSEALNDFREICYYSIKGGKKIRAILALEVYMAKTGKKLRDIELDSDIAKLCFAIEIIHSFSLVHDDLPCMDNDEYRRGEETVWKKYGEYKAVLTGDLLNTLALEVLSDLSDPKIAIKVIKLLSSATGFHGMVGGQIEDLYYEREKEPNSLKNIEALHNKKTGALIKASVLAGAIISGKAFEEKLAAYGEYLGLAFQIRDDILDVEGTLEETGKSVGGEEKGFVHFLGLEKTKEQLQEVLGKAKDSVSYLKSEKLSDLIDYVGNRKK